MMARNTGGPKDRGQAGPAARKFGRHIVADPKVCHGKLTFAGTRVFVRDVLDMVAQGMDWDAIIKEWHGSITREAIAEAVQLAGRALLDHADEYAEEAASA
jgi:uncharacterized protein (DUF433 family)